MLHRTDPRKRVDEDRSIMIDASVVRIMKARKMLAHSELVVEVLSQLAVFRPRQKDIKHRVEHLIEREYLKRSEEQPNVYLVRRALAVHASRQRTAAQRKQRSALRRAASRSAS